MFSSTACRSLCLILEGLLKKGGDVTHVPWEATAEWTTGHGTLTSTELPAHSTICASHAVPPVPMSLHFRAGLFPFYSKDTQTREGK